MDFPSGKVHRVIARPEKIRLDAIYIFLSFGRSISGTKKVKKKNDNQRVITKDRCKKSSLTLFYTDIIFDDSLVHFDIHTISTYSYFILYA